MKFSQILRNINKIVLKEN